MLKAIKNWYNKQQAISNKYKKEAIKNFTEAGITIINIKKLFFKIIPIIATLAIVFTVCNLRRLYFPNGIAHRYARMKERGLCGGLPFIIFKECGMPLQLAL